MASGHIEVHNVSQTPSDPLRALLHSSLAWQDAHASLDSALAGLPAKLRGAVAPGLPWSIWQIVEHMRRAQHDIYDFCINPDYKEMHFPDDYWPKSAEPESPNAWDECLAAFKRDLSALQDIAADTSRDLSEKIPHGSGQTYARELVLVVDHNAYHVGQIIALRRLLGAWPT